MEKIDILLKKYKGKRKFIELSLKSTKELLSDDEIEIIEDLVSNQKRVRF